MWAEGPRHPLSALVPRPAPPTLTVCGSVLPGDILEEDEDYLDELSQPVVSDSELGGDDPSDAPGSTAAPPSKSPALPKKKQHPTYRGSGASPS